MENATVVHDLVMNALKLGLRGVNSLEFLLGCAAQFFKSSYFISNGNFQTNFMAIIFQTKTAQNHNTWGGTYLYTTYTRENSTLPPRLEGSLRTQTRS